MRYFSLFSGVGGFELGIEMAYGMVPRCGVREPSGQVLPDSSSVKIAREGQRVEEALCVGFSEIDKHASAVLRYRFPDIKNYGAIEKIDWSTVPDFDLLVGGSPCQDFSIAGKRAGLVGARSGLAFEFIRALEEKRPAHFIWENVKGVLSSNRGWDFAAILNSMAEAGYSLWWQVLNARDHGVPQNRERVFVVGTRNGCPREVFFEAGAGAEGAPTCLDASCGEEAHSVATRHLGRNGGLRMHHASAVQVAETPCVIATGVNNPSRGYEARKDGLACSLRSGESGSKNLIRWQNKTVGAVQDDTVPSLRASGGTDIRKKPVVIVVREATNTLDTGMQQHTLSPDARIRRLTPVECERLMSWPDDWTRYGEAGQEVSDTQRYKMCGNGVVSRVVAEVVRAHMIDPPPSA